jgi:predicted AlkP superfamily phosphohydrolase/phosphomutase
MGITPIGGVCTLSTCCPELSVARKRVLVLGLDGADWRILDPLISEGRLPALGQLVDAGAAAPLVSTIPPLTAPAWTSFLLGAGPGSHGVLDFIERDARRYEGTTGKVVNSSSYPRRTFFDVASRAGVRVAAVRVPMMFPPWSVNGVAVSGGFTPGGRVFCSPRELAGELDVGPIDIGKRLLELPEHDQVHTLEIQLRRVEEQARRVLAMEPFELAMVHVHTPDNAHHCFWHHLEGRSDNGHLNPIHDLYSKVDGFVARMSASTDWDLVLVASDHGGGPRPARRFLVNVWLAKLGLLHLRGGYRGALSQAAASGKRRFKRLGYRVRRWAPSTIQRRISSLTQAAVAVDWSRTEAYGVYVFQPFYGIELNVAGRQDQGIVPERAYRVRRDRIVTLLRRSAEAEGLPIVAVMTSEEAFGPQHDPRLPDILVQLEDDLVGDNATGPAVVIPNRARGPHEGSGAHSREGVLIAAGAGVRPGRYGPVPIEGVAATVLAYLGVPPLTGMANPLTQLFEPDHLAVGSPPPGDVGQVAPQPTALTRHEEEEILRSLRGLGYLE